MMSNLNEMMAQANFQPTSAVTPGWKAGLKWLVAFAGFPIGGAAAYGLIGSVDSPVDGLIGGAVAGAVIGTAQWLVLRQSHGIDARWIAASSAGLAGGLATSVALFGTTTGTTEIAVRGAITGLVLGAAQWYVLRKQVLKALWWIPIIAFTYALAWLVTRVVIGDSVSLGFTVFGASGAIVFQLITGAVLQWLLPRRATSTQK